MARKKAETPATNVNGQAVGGTTPPSSNSTPNGFVDHKTLRQRQELIANLEHMAWEVRNNYMARFQRVQHLMDPRRDIDDECGYARNASQLNAEFYQLLYETDPIANRIVEVMTKEAYSVCPEVYEDEDEGVETEFEAARKELSQSLRQEESHFVVDYEGDPLDEYLERLNLVAGIGQYGVMLLGLPGDPIQPVEARKGQKLSGLRVFPELYAQITGWDTDRESDRFGHPQTYQLTFADPHGRQSIVGAPLTQVNVHWSRVIHVPSDKIISNELLGMERCRPHYRRIYDLQKLYGASAEGYWLSCFNLLITQSNPNMDPNTQMEDPDAFKDMWEKMMSGLQRWGYISGGTVNAIGPSIIDATPFIDKAIEAICIKEGIPVPVFKGYEIGEQASTENRMQWDDRMRKYQNRWITPRTLVPFYDRLINLGVLPKPGAGKKKSDPEPRPTDVTQGKGKPTPTGYRINWPDISLASDLEKADVFSKRMAAFSAYYSGGVEAIIPPLDMLTREAGYDKEEAEQIVETATEHMDEVNQQEMDRQATMIDEGLVPDPTAQPAPKAKAPSKTQ